MAPLTTSRVLSNYAPIGAGRRTSSFKALGVTDTAAPTYLSFTRPWHKVYFGLFYLLQHLTSKANIYPGYVNGFILWLSKSELHRMSLRTSQVRGISILYQTDIASTYSFADGAIGICIQELCWLILWPVLG